MNVINIDIDFTKGICEKSGISVVTGDFNSTKLVFNFAEEYQGTKIFELRHINSEIPTYVGEIINNEVVLVGTKEEEGQTIIYSLFDQVGDYVFEVSLYQNDSKLTSMFGYITARQEQVIVGDELVEPYMPIFDTLILEINTKLDEMDSAIQSVANLDIDVEKVEDTTTVTITRQDGSQKSENIEDGLDGVSLENMEIINKDLYVTYGGNTNDLGQVAPNIQIGTTTTGSPSTNASVENVGTDLNPILNFTIPKGEAGSIKFEIVQQLPTEDIKSDTIYLVPYSILTVQELPSTGQAHTIYIVESTNKRYIYESGQWVEISSDNRYVEYIYINNQWEELGGINVDIDLSDYVKNTDYATNSTGGVIKFSTSYGTTVGNDGILKSSARTYEQYTSANDGLLIGKGTLENVISGKGLVSNTDYATGSVGGVIKAQPTYNFNVSSGGSPYANARNYSDYQIDNTASFISKGTLENVITGKGLVSNTDYANGSVAGVIKTPSGSAIQTSSAGNLQAQTKTYADYTSGGNGMFIGKGTLENVITGKDLTTKSYVDGLVGDINTALDTINGEVI